MSTQLLLQITAILVGFAGLIWSADRFVAGAASFAKTLGMSTMMIGLTIVSLGTSAPEVIVALSASLEGSGQMALGNALGSNLANIGLVLAVTAIIAPIPIAKSMFRLEAPFLIVITAILAAILYDGELTMGDSLILVAAIPAFLILVAKVGTSPAEEEEIESYPPLKAAALFFFGLALLILSSETLVWGAKGVALSMGVSELVIGLTIVAVGTSLPELAASIASALKGHHDIALGNVIGSNIFNIMAVISVPGFIAPLAVGEDVLNRDYPSMALLTALLILLCAISLGRKVPKLGRSVGFLLLALYIGYYFMLMM